MLTQKEFNEKFIYNLSEIFRIREINRRQLASEIDIPTITMRSYGQRRRMPSTYRAYKIATRLGMTVDNIINGDLDKEEATLKNAFLPSQEEFSASLQKNLNQLLEDHKLTKKDVADKTGLAKGTITNIFNGKRAPELAMLYIIANALEIKVSSLLKPAKY